MSLNHISQYSQLTNDHFQAIGKLVVEWSNIEFLLRATLTRLLLTPEFPGRTFTDRLTAAKVQEALDEAIELHRQRYACQLVPCEVLDELVEINKQIARLRGNRNRFAHFCWCRSNDEEIFGTSFSGGVPGSRKERKSSITMRLSELKKLYDKSYEIVELLDKAIAKLPVMKEDGIKRKLA